MCKIDLDVLGAELQMAQEQGRKMCTIPTSDLMSLLMRAKELAKVQSMVPFKIGYIYPEDVHRLMSGELHRVGLSRKRGPKYNTEVLAQFMPSNFKSKIDLESLLAEET